MPIAPRTDPGPGPVPRRAARIVVAAVLLTLGAWAGVAGAHATLQDSTPGNDETVPEVPGEVELRFDEAVRAVGEDALVVLDPAGEPVAEGDARVTDAGLNVQRTLGSGPDGTYTVSYRVLSEDGHVITGSYVFHVGRASGAAIVADDDDPIVSAAGVIGRLLAFAGALLAVGAVGVARLVDRAPGPPPAKVWVTAGVLATVGTPLAAVALAAQLTGGTLADGVASIDLLGEAGRWTALVAWVVAALFLLLALASTRRAVFAVPAAAVALVGLWLPSFSGHAWVRSPLAVGVDMVHLLGAAMWIGGLATVALTWRDDRERLARYSRLAGLAAIAVLLSGAASAWLLGGRLGDLVDDRWGRTLLVKVGLVAAVLLFGWIHRRWIADEAVALTGMVRGFRVELAVAVAVLGATAVLVDQPPPEAPAPAPFTASRQAGEVTVRLNVTPALAGSNDVRLEMLAMDGSLQAVDAVQLEVSSDDVASRRVPVEATAPSRAVGRVELTPGEWTFEVTVVRDGVGSSTRFEVPVA